MMMTAANGTRITADTILRNIVDALCQKNDGRDVPGHNHSIFANRKNRPLNRVRLVQPLTHFLAGFEERHRFLVDSHMSSGPGISAGSRRPVLHRKGAEATQLDAVTFGHGAGDLAKNGVDDIFDVALVEVRILGGNSLDKL
jgi:hypothetical protein